MLVTFHRAIDMAVDPVAAVAAVISTGCDKILTSGGAQTVLEGAATVRRMAERAGGKVDIIAAAGVTEDNAAAVLEVSACSSRPRG
jgi:copper homeostasis protein